MSKKSTPTPMETSPLAAKLAAQLSVASFFEDSAPSSMSSSSSSSSFSSPVKTRRRARAIRLTSPVAFLKPKRLFEDNGTSSSPASSSDEDEATKRPDRTPSPLSTPVKRNRGVVRRRPPTPLKGGSTKAIEGRVTKPVFSMSERQANASIASLVRMRMSMGQLMGDGLLKEEDATQVRALIDRIKSTVEAHKRHLARLRIQPNYTNDFDAVRRAIDDIKASVERMGEAGSLTPPETNAMNVVMRCVSKIAATAEDRILHPEAAPRENPIHTKRIRISRIGHKSASDDDMEIERNGIMLVI